MALVTIERSPSPSDSAEADELDALDASDVNSPPKKRSRSGSALRKLKKLFNTIRFVTKLNPGFSESYFTVKGAAVILPQSDETAFARHATKSHGSDDIQSHLQAMFSILRQQDTIKVAVQLEGPHVRYLAVVSCIGRQDAEESVLLGIDMLEKPVIGLVLPLWAHTHIQLDGDGGFCIHSDDNIHSFKPVSVQAMWSALQTLNKVVKIAIENLYTPRGLSHAWVEYYKNRLSKESFIVAKWNASSDRDNWYRSDKLYRDSGGDVKSRPNSNLEHPVYTSAGEEDMHKRIRHELKNVMMTVDLEEVTCMFLRQSIEKKLHKDLNDYKSFIDTEMMEILGQMDAPSKIFDYLYLGSEWNASNLEELQKTGINHILNISCEIDNFFPGVLYYMNVREWDVEQSDLMRHWDDTYKYINKARKRGSKTLVHCKMGISRSASTVIAFLMKEKKWSLNEAYEYTRSKRSIVNPNPGFWKQLETYEGILKANMHRPKFDVIAVLRPIKLIDDIHKLPKTEASLLPVEIGKDHPDFGISDLIHKEKDIETASVSANSANDSLLKATETSPKKYFRYLEKHKNDIGDLSCDSYEETDSDSSSSDDEDVSSHEDNGEKDDDHRDIACNDSEDGSHALFVPIELPHVKIDDVGVQRNFFNSESKRSKSEGDKSSLAVGESFSPASREGSVSKFKPDGSWIKPVNEVSEIEVKEPDPVPVLAGVMHIKDVGFWMGRKDDEMLDLSMKGSVSGEQQREVIIGDKDPNYNSSSGSKQSCCNVDPFTRENIPWSTGSVEKQKQSTEIKYCSPSSAVNKKTDTFEISDGENPVNSAFFLAGKMEDANCGNQDSENHDIHCCESQRMEVDVCEQLDIRDGVGQSMEREKINRFKSTEPVHESGPPKESEDMTMSMCEHKKIVPQDRTETKILSHTKSNEDPTEMFVKESSTTSKNDHYQEKSIEFQISGNPDAECQTSSMKVSIPECQTGSMKVSISECQTGSVKVFNPEDVEIQTGSMKVCTGTPECQTGSMKVYTGTAECQTGSMKVYSPEDVEIQTASMKIYSPVCQTGSMKVYSPEDVDIQTDSMKLDSTANVECQSGCVKVYKYLGEELTVEEGLVRKNTLVAQPLQVTRKFSK